MENFKVIIVEDVPLELKGTLGIVKNDIPEAEVIDTAENEQAYWKLLKQQIPDLVLLDLGLGIKLTTTGFISGGVGGGHPGKLGERVKVTSWWYHHLRTSVTGYRGVCSYQIKDFCLR